MSATSSSSPFSLPPLALSPVTRDSPTSWFSRNSPSSQTTPNEASRGPNGVYQPMDTAAAGSSPSPSPASSLTAQHSRQQQQQQQQQRRLPFDDRYTNAVSPTNERLRTTSQPSEASTPLSSMGPSPAGSPQAQQQHQGQEQQQRRDNVGGVSSQTAQSPRHGHSFSASSILPFLAGSSSNSSQQQQQRKTSTTGGHGASSSRTISSGGSGGAPSTSPPSSNTFVVVPAPSDKARLDRSRTLARGLLGPSASVRRPSAGDNPQLASYGGGGGRPSLETMPSAASARKPVPSAATATHHEAASVVGSGGGAAANSSSHEQLHHQHITVTQPQSEPLLQPQIQQNKQIVATPFPRSTSGEIHDSLSSSELHANATTPSSAIGPGQQHLLATTSSTSPSSAQLQKRADAHVPAYESITGPSAGGGSSNKSVPRHVLIDGRLFAFSEDGRSLYLVEDVSDPSRKLSASIPESSSERSLAPARASQAFYGDLYDFGLISPVSTDAPSLPSFAGREGGARGGGEGESDSRPLSMTAESEIFTPMEEDEVIHFGEATRGEAGRFSEDLIQQAGRSVNETRGAGSSSEVPPPSTSRTLVDSGSTVQHQYPAKTSHPPAAFPPPATTINITPPLRSPPLRPPPLANGADSSATATYSKSNNVSGTSSPKPSRPAVLIPSFTSSSSSTAKPAEGVVSPPSVGGGGEEGGGGGSRYKRGVASTLAQAHLRSVIDSHQSSITTSRQRESPPSSAAPLSSGHSRTLSNSELVSPSLLQNPAFGSSGTDSPSPAASRSPSASPPMTSTSTMGSTTQEKRWTHTPTQSAPSKYLQEQVMGRRPGGPSSSDSEEDRGDDAPLAFKAIKARAAQQQQAVAAAVAPAVAPAPPSKDTTSASLNTPSPRPTGPDAPKDPWEVLSRPMPRELDLGTPAPPPQSTGSNLAGKLKRGMTGWRKDTKNKSTSQPFKPPQSTSSPNTLIKPDGPRRDRQSPESKWPSLPALQALASREGGGDRSSGGVTSPTQSPHGPSQQRSNSSSGGPNNLYPPRPLSPERQAASPIVFSDGGIAARAAELEDPEERKLAENMFM